MANTSGKLRARLEGIAERNQNAVKRIPFIGAFLDDLVAIFESLVTAIEELETRIAALEKKKK